MNDSGILIFNRKITQVSFKFLVDYFNFSELALPENCIVERKLFNKLTFAKMQNCLHNGFLALHSIE